MPDFISDCLQFWFFDDSLVLLPYMKGYLMDISFDGSKDLDELFKPSKSARRKMNRIADFNGFDFVSDNLLVRKSDQDLWRLQPDGSIERLFEASEEPLEG